MADGGYCDFPPGMDPHLLSQLAACSGRSGAESFDGSQHKSGLGFYQDQYSTIEEMASAMQAVSRQQQINMVSSTNTASTAAAGLYEPTSVMNYALKPEKGLPPTPPGSPSEGSSHQSNQHQQLAKPVPVRRMSEKRINHARASLTSASNAIDNIVGMFDPSHAKSIYSHATAAASASSPTLARALAAVQQTQKRPRSEKKPIPVDQKDNKYFERRKRNNMAAKKSRDARKSREDEIAIRASFLEKENAILRAQVATLREEANSLKQLLLQKRSRP